MPKSSLNRFDPASFMVQMDSLRLSLERTKLDTKIPPDETTATRRLSENRLSQDSLLKQVDHLLDFSDVQSDYGENRSESGSSSSLSPPPSGKTSLKSSLRRDRSSQEERAESTILSWLTEQCDRYANKRAGLIDSRELRDSLVALLSSDANEYDLQSKLCDMLGYEDLDFISQLVQRASQIKQATLEPATSSQADKAEGVPDRLSKVHVYNQNDLDALKSQRKINRQNARSSKLSTDTSDASDGEKSAFRLLNKREMDEVVRRNREEAGKAPSTVIRGEIRYPHVYKNYNASGNTLSSFGSKFSLPSGSEREIKNYYEEITIPFSKNKPFGVDSSSSSLLKIKDLDVLCQGTFKGYKTLNKVQSLVYPVAYQTNENMLICAPTGAGKTDVAMLSVLHTISQFCEGRTDAFSDDGEVEEEGKSDFDVSLDDFKIVYVAPLKALAAEIVDKMSRRLAWLGISVKELTGDMQLTRAEIQKTQMIVTTPEKWDVVTRKSTGDSELVQKVRLLIIDEVHLLHEDRGAVIESLVARTLRLVESTQSMIRIVGLSATLPNYTDVAEFLGVNLYAGLFFFDASFRPIPLEQHLVGVKGKAGSRTARENLDRVAYEKVSEMLKEDHQMMVFVHSRKDTVKTARTLYSLAQEEGDLDLLDTSDDPRYKNALSDLERSKNREIRELFRQGFGIHHAGMLRSDRNLIERLFSQGLIKVLCCTATLAWGVNLPAAAVIIKGTEVYNPKKGGFTDLGISDVLQIFGRAGRPQFEKYGISYLCTSLDRMPHYVSQLTQQHPIESRLVERLADNLNAEISLGTVTNVDEGVQWLGYTYLFVRMRKNPLGYGIEWREVQDDPLLGKRRRTLIIAAAQRLHKVQMVVYDERTGSFTPKDSGRIASDFYLLNSSVEIFNSMMKPDASEADILSMISLSSEFDNIKSRDEEAKELNELRNDYSPCQIAGTTDTQHGKTNILLQAYISKAPVESFSLVSDCNYVAQNATRICRALFLIALNRRWGHLCQVLLSMCKAVELKLWPFEHPLAQFDLPKPVLRNLEAKDTPIETLREMEPAELGQLVHNSRMGGKLIKYLDNFPFISIEAQLAPLTRSVLRVHLSIEADFKWDVRLHGMVEFFWIWVEDSEDSEILHWEKLILNRNNCRQTHEMDFAIPLSDPLPSQIFVRVISDRWAGAESVTAVSFQHLILPDMKPIQTKLLDLQPLPISALHDPVVEAIYSPKFSFFNPMQTMLFHTLYNQSTNVFVGSPTGSGKTVAAELAMWWAFKEFPKSKICYIAPMKALVRERVDEWRGRLCQISGRKLVELTGDSAPDSSDVRKADILITTPEKFDGISRSWRSRRFVQDISLVIMDEIHLLASDRGPILEMIVSRMNYMSRHTDRPVRLMGMSTAVANAGDMAGWLGVKNGLFNFPQSVRPVPLQMFVDGFPDNLGFCPLMKSMNRPAFVAIKTHAPSKPVLIFVPSRRQTRLTGVDLINLCGMEENPRRFLHMSDDELAHILTKVKDETLKLTLPFGIGLHHAGLVDSDRRISHELFASSRIQILIATSTLAWGVNLPAFLVIVKGTQFFDAKIEGYRDMDLTDILQMMGRAGRPAFDTSGVAIIFTKESKKMFYKNFLHSGFPVESSLHKVLVDHIGAEIAAGTVTTRQEALNFMVWTYLFRRVHKNPTYYGLVDGLAATVNDYLVNLIDGCLEELTKSRCIQQSSDSGAEGSQEGGKLKSTPFLKLVSYYYISHKTMRNLLNNAHPNATFGECLQWLCEATEYDELPVRHNEHLVNIELSKHMRYPGEVLGKIMWDPHVKAFILLQAFMLRTNLPIADYIQDTVSVLDQSLRIIQACIDAVAELGIASTLFTFIRLMQCLKQACFEEDPGFSVLPGLEPPSTNTSALQDADEDALHDSELVPVDQSSNGNAEEPQIRLKSDANRSKKNGHPRIQRTISMPLDELARLPPGKRLEKAADKLGVAPQKRREFFQVVRRIPASNISVDYSKGEDDERSVYKIAVNLTHVNKEADQNTDRIYAPKFPKPQKESWFVIIANAARDEVVALSRANPREQVNHVKGHRAKEISANLKILTSDVPPSGELMLYVINDSIDLQYSQSLKFQ